MKFDLRDTRTWPAAYSQWRDPLTSTMYRVVLFANIEGGPNPPTVVYRNNRTNKIYAQPLEDWMKTVVPA